MGKSDYEIREYPNDYEDKDKAGCREVIYEFEIENQKVSVYLLAKDIKHVKITYPGDCLAEK